MAEELQTVSFKVPLLHRDHVLTFQVGKTVHEIDGCIKVKTATDDQDNTFAMWIVVRSLLEALPDAEEIERRVSNDLAMLKLLDHPSIRKLFQVFSTDACVYVLLEDCPVTLAEHIEESKGGLIPTEAQAMFKQLLEGVSAVHSKRLAHRNLNPRTVLLTDDEECKIANFCFAALQTSNDLLSDYPEGLDPAFTAPELLSRRGSYDGMKADMYSLGAVLHTMLCGRPPEGSKVSDDLPEGTKDLVCGLLEEDPEYRFTLTRAFSHPWVTGHSAKRTASFVVPLPDEEMRLQIKKSFSRVQSLRLRKKQESICCSESPRLASPIDPPALTSFELIQTVIDKELEPARGTPPAFNLSPRGERKDLLPELKPIEAETDLSLSPMHSVKRCPQAVVPDILLNDAGKMDISLVSEGAGRTGTVPVTVKVLHNEDEMSPVVPGMSSEWPTLDPETTVGELKDSVHSTWVVAKRRQLLTATPPEKSRKATPSPPEPLDDSVPLRTLVGCSSPPLTLYLYIRRDETTCLPIGEGV